MLGEQRAETKLTTDEMWPHDFVKDSVLERRGRERENRVFTQAQEAILLVG